MYHIRWDSKNNGIVLSNKIKPEKRIQPPRPVYFEELNLFGFKNYWDYPECEGPLLWSIGRNYYYKNIHVASVNGGNIFNAPEINILHSGTLEQIKINKIIERNSNAISKLEVESKRFINEVYKRNKNKYTFGVAFSGGKDSQVILELVSQVIPPDEYFVIFTDTEMELQPTYDTVKKTKKYYKSIYNTFNFYTAKQFNPIIKNWKTFGPPSRLQRWCCSVCKTVPYLKKIREISPDKKPLIVFEGVRRDESNRRNNYNRIARGVKHNSITNVRPIIDWNLTEIYLYLLYRKIKINPAYKYGLTRVGCMICPFSSEWSEYIINKLYPRKTEKFLNTIYETLPEIGITDYHKQKVYIQNGNWKKRGGGKCLLPLNSSCEIDESDNSIDISIQNAHSNIFKWLQIFNPLIKKNSNNSFSIEIFYNNMHIKFNIIVSGNSVNIYYKQFGNDVIFLSMLKKIAYKTTYCVKCGACEVECPTEAITLFPDLEIDTNKCINCFRCLNFVDKGCILAKSRHGLVGGSFMSNDKINFDRYSTFGLREEWLINTLNKPESWKDGLGSKQIPAFRRWLIESELFNDKKKPKHLLEILKNKSQNILWSIVWINLCRNSPIVDWYSNLIFKIWDRKELNEKIFIEFPYYSEGTLKNPVNALLNTFDNSHQLSEKMGLGILTKKGRAVVSIYKKGSNNIHPAALLYCLYKYAEKNEYYDFTLSELYEKDVELTPYRIFGIEKEYLKQVLRSLQEDKYKLIKVEFAANLDNLFLNTEYSSVEVLEHLLSKENL